MGASGLHPPLLRHRRDSDGKWQRKNEVLGSTFPKRAVILPRLVTVKVQTVLPWALVAFLQPLKKSSSKDFTVPAVGAAQASGQNLADMKGQHIPLADSPCPAPGHGRRMGILIMTPQTHSAFCCPGVAAKGMVSTGGGASLDAWQWAVSSWHGAGTCAGSLLPGRASGISLPEAAVRLIGEPQPVVTSCPRGVPIAWCCPGHRFSMPHPCPCREAELPSLPCAVGRGAIRRGIWGSPDHQLLVVPSAPQGLGKLPILGALERQSLV